MNNSAWPTDYAARVYAGVLGKIIGVYLGRPFEQWPYEKIESTFGDIDRYVHQEVGAPLVVTDDDITGTFTFVRALEDNGTTAEITAEQIGWNWLNYIIENRTILWWGGIGYAAEHTAFMRLKSGIPAPRSGSIELNGWQVAQEIGSQIFIEGWAWVAPGNPQLAADLARKAASVSHDREGIYGAQVIAVMVAQAFGESDLNALIDCALTFIPADCEIARCIADVRAWHETEPNWRATRQKIVEKWGYERYGTNCPIVSNHAIVMLGLLYGDDDFSRSLQITCNAAYDTDCNAANVGAILGVKNGLAGLDRASYDWRGPVADRLFLPNAEGGSCFSDALTVSTKLVNVGRVLAGLAPELPKDGARFHFSQPGSVQGFTAENEALEISNVERDGERGLLLRATESASDLVASVETFRVDGAGDGYALVGNPSVFPGQILRAQVRAETVVEVALVIHYYDENDEIRAANGPFIRLDAGQHARLEWPVPEFDGQPIASVGLQLRGGWRCFMGFEPDVGRRTRHGFFVSSRAAVRCGSARGWTPLTRGFLWEKDYNVIIQNRGRGLISTGTHGWKKLSRRRPFQIARRARRRRGCSLRRTRTLLRFDVAPARNSRAFQTARWRGNRPGRSAFRVGIRAALRAVFERPMALI